MEKRKINTISKLKNFTASNNTAFYDGGVIYVMYGIKIKLKKILKSIVQKLIY